MRVLVWLLISANLVCFATLAQAQEMPWIDVPESLGFAGPATCVTRPTGVMQPIATITCDPAKLGAQPIASRVFLRAHEHGHVYQLAFNPALFYSPFAEYDADCYAAIWMAHHDQPNLTTIIQLFELMGPRGGDATHGNGFQMAARVRECASHEGFAPPMLEFEGVMSATAPVGGPTPFGNDERQPSAPQADLQAMEAIVSHGPDDVPDRGTPNVCTAIDMIRDAAHTSFWEARSGVGEIRNDLSNALGKCRVEQSHGTAECALVPSTEKQVEDSISSCFDKHDWEKKCSGQDCSVETFEHRHDGGHHVVVRLDKKRARLLFQAPAAEPANARKE